MPQDAIDREWRDEFRERLKSIERSQSEILQDISSIKLGQVKAEEMIDLRKRLRVLEDFKLRTVAIIFAVQVILTAAWAVFSKFKP